MTDLSLKYRVPRRAMRRTGPKGQMTGPADGITACSCGGRAVLPGLKRRKLEVQG